MSGVEALAAELQAQGGSLAAALRSPQSRPRPDPAPAAEPGPAQLAAAGPRARGHQAEYELLLEMIFEGALLHYGTPRVLALDDPDLALLLGDQLYAMGLSRLAALGDLDAVAELADVISLVAQAAAAGDEGLTGAIWAAGAVAIGWGSTAALEDAKARARVEDPLAEERLRAAANAANTGHGGPSASDGRLEVDDTLTSAFNSDA
jgi:hypothetical protein